jgi:nitrite reductase/ring-hydroxylating ferredoxin subunit
MHLDKELDARGMRQKSGATSFSGHRMADEFIRVASIDELPPGRMRRVDVGKQRILLANVAGQFYATDDTCTHEDASLSSGFLKDEWVQCPLHGSRFNVRTGEAVDEPAEVNLGTYAVRIDGCDIWLRLA